jgi:hypothetical protein
MPHSGVSRPASGGVSSSFCTDEDHDMTRKTLPRIVPAACCLSNVRGLYVTKAEACSLVNTWTVLRELGVQFEDPLSGAIVAQRMLDGAMRLLIVKHCEIGHHGTLQHMAEACFLLPMSFFQAKRTSSYA